MKFLLLLLLLAFCGGEKLSFAENTYFAQIINPDTYLYRDCDENIIFELPQTYFVKISSYSNGYYTASYNGIKGYVKASSIKVITGVPDTPYLTNATFRLFANDYATLKGSPDLLSYDITTLPIDTPINYIGSIQGKELISGRGRTWYYCNYEKDGQTYSGYVYAGLCDNLNLSYNTEIVEYMPNPYVTVSTEYIEYLNSDSGKRMVLLPVIITSCLFALLLFLPLIVKNYKTKPSPIFNIEDGKI